MHMSKWLYNCMKDDSWWMAVEKLANHLHSSQWKYIYVLSISWNQEKLKFTPTTPAQTGPECAPILSWRGRSGRCGILKLWISSNIRNAIRAIWVQNNCWWQQCLFAGHLSCMQGPVADREARYRHVSISYRLNLRKFQVATNIFVNGKCQR